MINIKDKIGDKLLIASGNKGKIKEISDLLLPFNIEVIGADIFNLIEPIEDGQTFAQNAIIKAKYYFEKTNIPSLADDSGLCVNALGGKPGIYSARLAGEDKNFYKAMDKIEKMLIDKNTSDYSAKFICSLCIYLKDDNFEVFEGEIKGSLSFPPKGDKGFGYDPIFTANGQNKTFAQMNSQEKHAISHRAKAFEKLAKAM